MIQLLALNILALVFTFSLAQAQTQTKKPTKPTQKTSTTATAPAKKPQQQPATKVINKPVSEPLEFSDAPIKRKPEPKGAWFVEPYVGVELATIDATTTAAYPPAGNYSFSANALALGTRGGYNLSNDIFFAADLQFTVGGQIQPQSQPAGANKPSDNFYKIMLGAQAGWKPWESFQFWGGYFLMNDLTDQGSSGNRVFHGDGFRLGVGWVFSKHITFGFNYDILTYKKVDASGTSYNLSNDYSKFNPQIFHFNCSFPFFF